MLEKKELICDRPIRLFPLIFRSIKHTRTQEEGACGVIPLRILSTVLSKALLYIVSSCTLSFMGTPARLIVFLVPAMVVRLVALIPFL